jgi:hypothetical protein
MRQFDVFVDNQYYLVEVNEKGAPPRIVSTAPAPKAAVATPKPAPLTAPVPKTETPKPAAQTAPLLRKVAPLSVHLCRECL